ncbi:MAG: hypothetical protein PVH63_00730 [Balneolaceae bacterium]
MELYQIYLKSKHHNLFQRAALFVAAKSLSSDKSENFKAIPNNLLIRFVNSGIERITIT